MPAVSLQRVDPQPLHEPIGRLPPVSMMRTFASITAVPEVAPEQGVCASTKARHTFRAACSQQLNECVQQLLRLDGRALGISMAFDVKTGWKDYLLQFKSLADQPRWGNFGQYVANSAFVSAVLKDLFGVSGNALAKLTPEVFWNLIEYYRAKFGDDAIDRLAKDTDLIRPDLVSTLPSDFFSQLPLSDCKKIVECLGADAVRLKLRAPRGSHNPMLTALLDYVRNGHSELLGAQLFCQLNSLQSLKTIAYQDLYQQVFSTPALISQIDPQLIRQMGRPAWQPAHDQAFAISPEALSHFSPAQVWAIPVDALDANLLSGAHVKTVFDAIPVGKRIGVNYQYWIDKPSRIGKLSPAERQILLRVYVNIFPPPVIAAFSAEDVLNYFQDPRRPEGDDHQLVARLAPEQLTALSPCLIGRFGKKDAT